MQKSGFGCRAIHAAATLLGIKPVLADQGRAVHHSRVVAACCNPKCCLPNTAALPKPTSLDLLEGIPQGCRCWMSNIAELLLAMYLHIPHGLINGVLWVALISVLQQGLNSNADLLLIHG